MKTPKILFHQENTSNEETPKKMITVKLLKPFIVILMLSYMMILTSCLIGFRGQRHDRGGVIVEHRGHDEHHNDRDHHDDHQDNRHDDHR